MNTVLDYYPYLDWQSLALFGTLIGQEHYISEGFRWELLQLREQLMGSVSYEALLEWLNQYASGNKAKEALLSIEMDEDMKKYIDDRYTKITDYKHRVELKEIRSLIDDAVAPEWFYQQVKGCQISRWLIDVYRLRQVFLPPIYEDITSNNVHECTLFIRKIIYGLLLKEHPNSINVTNVAEMARAVIEKTPQNLIDYVVVIEWQRVNNTTMLTRSQVAPLYTLPNGLNVPTLYEIGEMCLKERTDFFFECLNVPAELDEIEWPYKPLTIFVCAMIYWRSHSQVATDLNEMCILMAVVRTIEKALYGGGEDVGSHQKILDAPVKDRNKLHVYQEFETCFYCVMALNQILMALPNISPSFLSNSAACRIEELIQDDVKNNTNFSKVFMEKYHLTFDMLNEIVEFGKQTAKDVEMDLDSYS